VMSFDSLPFTEEKLFPLLRCARYIEAVGGTFVEPPFLPFHEYHDDVLFYALLVHPPL